MVLPVSRRREILRGRLRRPGREDEDDGEFVEIDPNVEIDPSDLSGIFAAPTSGGRNSAMRVCQMPACKVRTSSRRCSMAPISPGLIWMELNF